MAERITLLTYKQTTCYGPDWTYTHALVREHYPSRMSVLHAGVQGTTTTCFTLTYLLVQMSQRWVRYVPWCNALYVVSVRCYHTSEIPGLMPLWKENSGFLCLRLL